MISDPDYFEQARARATTYVRRSWDDFAVEFLEKLEEIEVKKSSSLRLEK
jgi:hypothetical protein